MMYLSRLALNLRSRQVRSELADFYQMHRTVMSAFPEKLQPNERVLFRLDIHPRTGVPILLVQSQYQPDWCFLTRPDKDYLLLGEDLALGLENPAVKTVNLAFTPGQVLSFRLRANPTVKKDRPGKKQGRRVGLLRQEDQLDWLKRKIEVGGASLLSASFTHDQFATGKLYRGSSTHDLQYVAVQIDGTLQVKDPARFQETLQAGIGSGKGMGFGLLSLAPARG